MYKCGLALFLFFLEVTSARATNTQQVSGISTSASPSMTVCNGSVWLAWKGEGSDTAIYVAPSATGAKPATTILSTYTVENPISGGAVPAYYYLFTPQTKVASVATAPIPGFVGTVGGAGGLKPVTGSKTISVTTPSTDKGPAIACLSNTLYLFWRNSPDGVLYWAQSKAPALNPLPSYNTAAPLMGWTHVEPINVFGVQAPSLAPGPQPPLQTATAKTSSAPSVAVANGAITVAYRGDTSNDIYFASFNPTVAQWSAPTLFKIAGSGEDSTTPVTPQTGDSPAIAIIANKTYLAWKGLTSTTLWWSQIAPIPVAPAGTYGAGQPVFNMPLGAIGWAQQQIPNAASNSAPALIADGNGALWLSWVPLPGEIDANEEPVPPIAFANLNTGQGPAGGGAWSIAALRVGMPTGVGDRVALASTSNDSTGIMAAWKNPGSDPGISIGPLRLPAMTYTFTITSVAVVNTRSGSIASHLGPFSSASSDTDYITLAAQASGTSSPAKGAWSLGNLQNGQSNAPYNALGVGAAAGAAGDVSVTVPDNSQVVVTYLANNYGEGTATEEVQLLQLASQKLVVAGASAAGSAVGTALGAAIGSAIGTGTVPLIGSALGALAGWGVGQAWGIAFPDCDGPVAAGLHVFSSYDLYYLTDSTAPPKTNSPTGTNVVRPNSYTAVDLNPAPGAPPITTQSGCGSNPIYNVYWTISRGNLVPGGGSND